MLIYCARNYDCCRQNSLAQQCFLITHSPVLYSTSATRGVWCEVKLARKNTGIVAHLHSFIANNNIGERFVKPDDSSSVNHRMKTIDKHLGFGYLKRSTSVSANGILRTIDHLLHFVSDITSEYFIESVYRCSI